MNEKQIIKVKLKRKKATADVLQRLTNGYCCFWINYKTNYCDDYDYYSVCVLCVTNNDTSVIVVIIVIVVNNETYTIINNQINQ